MARSFFVVSASSLVVSACSGAPHAPPAPIEDPAPVVASASASAPIVEPGRVAVLDPQPSSNPAVATQDGPLRAELAPGLERVERISLLEGGTRCGTRIGKGPICIGDSRSGALSREALPPVKKIEALGVVSCVLGESGKLGCDIARGTKSSISSTNVDDFVIGPHDEVYALSRGGNVVANIPNGDGTVRTKIVIRGASDIASALSGVCARTLKGGIECTDIDSPFERASHSVNGMDGVLSIEFGGVIRKKDKTVWALGEDKADPFRALRVERPDGTTVTANDFAWEPTPCIVTIDGGVSCVDFAQTPSITRFVSRRVELPRPAVRIRPRGAECAELDDGTVACWGASLVEMRRLGLRVLSATPGSVAPRP